MLSFVYNLSREFEQKLGYKPNVLFINESHLESLHDSFSEDFDEVDIRQTLGLEVLMRQDAIHPSVHWLASAARRVG